MARAKIAITVDENAVREIDRLVRAGVYTNRSQAFEAAIKQRIEHLRHSRLAHECTKLDRDEEKALADERYAGEGDWSEY